MLNPLRNWRWVGWAGTGFSALVILWLQWLQLPGFSLAGVAVDWAVVWVVCWSYQRSVGEGLTAGLILGLLLDGMTAPLPTHIVGLMLVGAGTSYLKGYRFLQSDPLAVGLLAFAMAVVQETTLALQFVSLYPENSDLIWTHHQRVSLASGLLACLWAPLLWWLLQAWWNWSDTLEG